MALSKKTRDKIHSIVNSGNTAPYRALKKIAEEINTVSKNVQFYWMPSKGKELFDEYCSVVSLTPMMGKAIVGERLCTALIFSKSQTISFDDGAVCFPPEKAEDEFEKLIDQEMEAQLRTYFHV